MSSNEIIETVDALFDSKISKLLEDDSRDEAHEFYRIKILVLTAIEGYYRIVPALKMFRNMLGDLK